MCIRNNLIKRSFSLNYTEGKINRLAMTLYPALRGVAVR